MGNSFIEFIDLEIMGVAVGISQLCCIQAKIQVFPVWESPSWIFYFRRITQYEKSFIEFLKLENMGVAIGILQLCCIHAETLVFSL